MKRIFEIQQEGKESVQPVLAMEIGEKHCCFSITDFASKELKKLAYYTTDSSDDDFLEQLFSSHPELSDSFYRVLVCYDYTQSCLVPSKYYNPEDGASIMNILTGLPAAVSIVAETINEWQVNNVYAVPKKIHDRISKTFTSGKYWHRNTVNIKNNSINETGSLLVNFRNSDFTVLASANGQLLLAQAFSYSTPDDVIYYLLKICRQFELSQQQVQIGLSGLIDKQSALYRELHQYFLHIRFRNASWIAPVNDESPAHFFTSLNDLASCAS